MSTLAKDLWAALYHLLNRLVYLRLGLRLFVWVRVCICCILSHFNWTLFFLDHFHYSCFCRVHSAWSIFDTAICIALIFSKRALKLLLLHDSWWIHLILRTGRSQISLICKTIIQVWMSWNVVSCSDLRSIQSSWNWSVIVAQMKILRIVVAQCSNRIALVTSSSSS